MLLHTIKLAGFKSFVDPTIIRLPSKLVSVVGPNGCGKSNIIDAVRWVMGENSPKELRGENRIDFIFKGSATRKPIGQASVELTFDNADGRLAGPYANYAEIVVRRTINTQGDSQYYLNGTPCRRSDVTSLFLGTGLGPRSYAIIQQGMISRLIEAKPDELRVHIEEAAGITRYKERRRETVIRIEHARANLLRLTDIRGELEQQLTRINKQAEVAIRYQKLVDEEALCKRNIETLQWQAYGSSIVARQQIIEKLQTQIESIRAEQRHAEKEIAGLHAELADSAVTLEKLRTVFYEQGKVISHLEASQKERENKLIDANQQQKIVQQQLDVLKQTLEQDTKRLVVLTAECDRLKPELLEKTQLFERADKLFHQEQSTVETVQKVYETALSEHNQSKHDVQVLEMRLEHTRSNIVQLQEKYSELEAEIASVTLLEEHCAGSNQKLEDTQDAERNIQILQAQWTELREGIDQKQSERNALSEILSQLRSQLHIESEQYAVLTALQKSAYGKKSEYEAEWLEAHDLNTSPRLLEQLAVSAGWEHAVETVLVNLLHAVGVDNSHAYLDKIHSASSLTLLSKSGSQEHVHHMPRLPQTLLVSKISSDWPLPYWMKDIYVAEDIESAKILLQQLNTHESVITPEGVWMGAQWIHINRVVPETDSAFVRQKSIQIKENLLKTLKIDIQAAEDSRRAIDLALEQDRAAEEPLRQKVDAAQKQHAQCLSELRVIEERQNTNQQRHQLLVKKYTESAQNIEINKSQYALLENQKNILMEGIHAKNLALQTSIEVRDQAKLTFESSRLALDKVRHELSEIKRSLDTAAVERSTLQYSHERLLKQKIESENRLTQLNEQINQLSVPDHDSGIQLKNALQNHVETEKILTELREAADQKQQQYEQNTQKAHALNMRFQQASSELSSAQRIFEDLKEKQQCLMEMFEKDQIDYLSILDQLKNTELTLDSCIQTQSVLLKRIAGFGPVNLVAPEEQKTLSERKVYLDAQHDDLMEALNTLEGAISSIDQETRSQFSKTYETVNAHFQSLFPKIFGGGKAELRLLEDDLLTTGVTVIAQPPGKRNSSIHLLSGGEKALTALALVFALFQLNPAPFCLLDEVDAPLDDANVQRFCSLVKSMADKTQFIVVTHNKLAMEMAEHLIGVTMQEAGVSRLVAVDVKAALALAEAE